jgi:hypothetical protein
MGSVYKGIQLSMGRPVLVAGSDTADVGELAGAIFARGWTHLGTVDPPLLHHTLDPEDDAWVTDYLADLTVCCTELASGGRADAAELRYT